jgi:Domain of unknown function (DUF5666)/Domain of unknown function (DUF5667)
MSERIYGALEVCLSALRTGVLAQQCQAIYPDLSESLMPALEAAQAARSLSVREVPAVMQRHSRTQLWEQATRLERQRARAFWLSRSLSPLRLVIVLAVLLAVLSLNGLAAASAQSLPGDVLYPVKRVAERVALQLAPAPQIRHQAEMAYIQRRIDEVHELTRAGRVEAVSFEGTLVQQSADTWIVDDVAVQIDSRTHFYGEVSPGTLVEVEGVILPDGQVRAEEVHVRSFQFSGAVISMGRTSWNVNGTNFQVLADTQIDSSVRVGDLVLVLARSEDDNMYYASAITNLSNRVVLLASKPSAPAIQMEWTDTVRSMSADSWLVGARTILLTAQTEVNAAIQVGDPVVVQGWLQPDGSLLAEEISLLASSNSTSQDPQSSLPGFTSPELKLNVDDHQGSHPGEEHSGSFSSQDPPKSSDVKGDAEVQPEPELNARHLSSKHDSSHESDHSQDQSGPSPAEQQQDD